MNKHGEKDSVRIDKVGASVVCIRITLHDSYVYTDWIMKWSLNKAPSIFQIRNSLDKDLLFNPCPAEPEYALSLQTM